MPTFPPPPTHTNTQRETHTRVLTRSNMFAPLGCVGIGAASDKNDSKEGESKRNRRRKGQRRRVEGGSLLATSSTSIGGRLKAKGRRQPAAVDGKN